MKKVMLHAVLIMISLASVCSAQKKPRYIKTETYEGVVFPMFIATAQENEKYAYMPTNKEIAAMEKKIVDSIGILFSNYVKHSAYKVDCNFQKDLKFFVRQYSGTRINGVKEIFTAFFLNPGGANWKKEQLSPGERSGEHCNEFFIKYSITTGKFLSFYTELSPI